jgi:hypothetical protein
MIIDEALWAPIPVPIDQVATEVSKKFMLPPFDIDAENIWEWAEVRMPSLHVWLNLTRRHDKGAPRLKDRMMIRFFADEPPAEELVPRITNFVDELATFIANEWKTPVVRGRIEYVRGEEYRYHERKRYAPEVTPDS